MKTHSVKSNAKRAARKLAEQFPGLVAVEPLATQAGGPWHAVVAAAEGFDPRTLPAGTFADVEFIAADGRVGAPAPLPPSDPVPEAIRDTPAGRLADAEMVEAAKVAQAFEPAEPMTKIIDQREGNIHLTVSVDPRIAAVLAQPAAEKAAKLKTAKAAKSLPPPTKSTREEIDTRREERRQRIADAKANPIAAKPKMGAVIVALCAREGGATSEELQAATGWQAHTLRGYIAGTLRKRGHAIELRREKDEASRYVIAKADAPTA